MPSSKSSRSSKGGRPSLLSLSSRSVSNLLSTVSPSRDAYMESLGQPVKELPTVTPEEDLLKVDESAAKPQRRKSRLNVLTSFFSPTSPPSASTKKPSASTTDVRRPRTAHEVRSASRIRERAVLRRPVASTVEFNSHHRKSSSEHSRTTTSDHHGSISTVDNSPRISVPGIPTPATQVSDFEFSFGFERTHSPEAADSYAESHPARQPGGNMPAVIQKHHRGSSAPDEAPQRPPPLPPKVPVAREGPSTHAADTAASTELPRSRDSDGSSGSSQPPSSNSKSDGRAKLQSTRRPSSVAVPRIRSSSAQPSLYRGSTADHSRTVSSPLDPRPTNEGEGRGRLRRSWMPGGRSSSASKELKKLPQSNAWIMSPDNHADYNTALLMNGDRVPELWNENGTVLVYLFSKNSGKGPSFKMPAQSIEASIVFHELIQGELESSRIGRGRGKSFDGRDTLGAEDATRLPQAFGAPETASGEVRLYLPPPAPGQDGIHDGKPDIRRFIAIRNLFAFLTGQPLVGTKSHPTVFSAFLEISSLLKEFDFMSMDGTTWGEAVDMSFGFYISQLALADVRHSREKTLEAVILGERMKSWELYNEAYTHAVGKWQAIVSLKSPLMAQVSQEVLRRLERANLDLLNRQHSVNQRLEEFEFPALFAGVAGSSEFKDIKFNRWKAGFSKMRGFTLEYYKTMFGSWPPKARSKKNPFSESGLNRLVLKALYADLCSLYDLLVDRDSLTPRVIDQAPEDMPDKDEDQHVRALRKMLTEFDQSEPPVLPPVPFDIPKKPTMKSVLANYDDLKEKERAKFDRNIKEHELQLVLHKSYNFDTDSMTTAFLEEFKDFDFDMAKGKNMAEMVDFRMGMWLFLYVVIQSLPLLVIDAPDLQFTEGVEYFLCQPPMGNPPWIEDAGATRKAWYQIPGSEVKVELSADVVMFSVEGTYERSHCWEVAKLWDEAKMNGSNADLLGLPPPPGGPAAAAADTLMPLSPLHPPGAVFEDMDPVGYHSSNGGSPASSAPGSPAGAPQRRSLVPGSGLAQGRGAGSSYRSSFAGVVGLEMLAAPVNIPVDRRSTRVFSAQAARADSLTPRPQSAGGSTPGSLRSARSSGNLRGESPGRLPLHGDSNNNRAVSSTFDDILKDMSNQQENAKPAKKKFGF